MYRVLRNLFVLSEFALVCLGYEWSTQAFARLLVGLQPRQKRSQLSNSRIKMQGVDPGIFKDLIAAGAVLEGTSSLDREFEELHSRDDDDDDYLSRTKRVIEERRGSQRTASEQRRARRERLQATKAVKARPTDKMPTGPVIGDNIPLNVIYEDASMIAVNKASGMIVHPTSIQQRDTFVNALKYHVGSKKGPLPDYFKDGWRLGVVHRLDANTSGIMLAGKTLQGQRNLVRAFAMRNVEKVYIAIVDGELEAPTTITAPIRKDQKKGFLGVMGVDPTGLPALTYLHPLYYGNGRTLIACRIGTGRSHQIRVHAAYLGHPVVGDVFYGQPRSVARASRPLLHAYQLNFSHPATEKPMTLAASPPDDFQTIASAIVGCEPSELDDWLAPRLQAAWNTESSRQFDEKLQRIKDDTLEEIEASGSVFCRKGILPAPTYQEFVKSRWPGSRGMLSAAIHWWRYGANTLPDDDVEVLSREGYRDDIPVLKEAFEEAYAAYAPEGSWQVSESSPEFEMDINELKSMVLLDEYPAVDCFEFVKAKWPDSPTMEAVAEHWWRHGCNTNLPKAIAKLVEQDGLESDLKVLRAAFEEARANRAPKGTWHEIY